MTQLKHYRTMKLNIQNEKKKRKSDIRSKTLKKTTMTTLGFGCGYVVWPWSVFFFPHICIFQIHHLPFSGGFLINLWKKPEYPLTAVATEIPNCRKEAATLTVHIVSPRRSCQLMRHYNTKGGEKNLNSADLSHYHIPVQLLISSAPQRLAHAKNRWFPLSKCTSKGFAQQNLFFPRAGKEKVMLSMTLYYKADATQLLVSGQPCDGLRGQECQGRWQPCWLDKGGED